VEALTVDLDSDFEGRFRRTSARDVTAGLGFVHLHLDQKVRVASPPIEIRLTSQDYLLLGVHFQPYFGMPAFQLLPYFGRRTQYQIPVRPICGDGAGGLELLSCCPKQLNQEQPLRW